MVSEISKVYLHTGRDLELGNGIVVRHPKVKDIVALNSGFMCSEIYWAYVSQILSDPYDSMVFLDDLGVDYEQATPFDVFALRWERAPDTHFLKEALGFFLGEHDFDLLEFEGQKILYDKKDPSYAFGAQIFHYVSMFVASINGICREDKIKPASPSAKRILIEDMRDEQRRALRKKADYQKEAHTDTIASFITAAVYGGVGNITPFNFSDLSVYQLITAALTAQKKQRTGAMLNGIYTGMLDAGKLSKDALRWD